MVASVAASARQSEEASTINVAAPAVNPASRVIIAMTITRDLPATVSAGTSGDCFVSLPSDGGRALFFAGKKNMRRKPSIMVTRKYVIGCPLKPGGGRLHIDPLGLDHVLRSQQPYRIYVIQQKGVEFVQPWWDQHFQLVRQPTEA